MQRLLGLASAAIMELVLVITCSAMEINTDGQKGVVRTISAKPYTKGTLCIGSGFSFAQSSDYSKGPVKNGTTTDIKASDGRSINASDIETARLFTSNLFLAVNPFRYFNFGINLPCYYDWSGISSVNDGGIGDLRLSAKMMIPSVWKGFYQGYYLSGSIPTGSKKNGVFPRNSYSNLDASKEPSAPFYSANSATLTGELLLTLDLSEFNSQLPILVHANIGGSATSHENQSNLLLTNFAIEYTPLYFLTFFIEFSGETRVENISTDMNPTHDPVLFTPGLKIATPSGFYFSLAGDISLSSRENYVRENQRPESGVAKNYQYSTGVIPSYGAQFTLGWNGFMTVQDDDRDGLKNNVDRCPRDAEDMDGFEDQDGCPDPDNDHDRIIDHKDKCPNNPEDFDGFKDEDGCPDIDNDGDNIDDISDHCPRDAEDMDGFEDLDGCPDVDNDKDGVVDSLDKCINVSEDFDGFQDDDGCPDVDNDNDGIPDISDRCVNVSEVFNNFQDNDGCPDTVKKEPDIPAKQILQNVQFRNNGPEMTFNSYQALEPLIRQLKQFTEVEIEVRAFTDSSGDFNKNIQLTQMRAEAVRQFLSTRGIESKRIRAVGLGASSPIADNRTASGRAQNRRIEIIRIK